MPDFSERDKFLNELIFGKYHDLNSFMTGRACRSCGVAWEESEVEGCYHINTDFSSPNGFFILWKWMKNQQCWNSFWSYTFIDYLEADEVIDMIDEMVDMIDPDKFANAVHEYFTETRINAKY